MREYLILIAPYLFVGAFLIAPVIIGKIFNIKALKDSFKL